MATISPVAMWTLTLSSARIAIAPQARQRVQAGRKVVEAAVASGATMYGINTGFGKLAGVRSPDDQLAQLQRNLLLSHATGVGEPLSLAVDGLVALMMWGTAAWLIASLF